MALLTLSILTPHHLLLSLYPLSPFPFSSGLSFPFLPSSPLLLLLPLHIPPSSHHLFLYHPTTHLSLPPPLIFPSHHLSLPPTPSPSPSPPPPHLPLLPLTFPSSPSPSPPPPYLPLPPHLPSLPRPPLALFTLTLFPHPSLPSLPAYKKSCFY